MRYGVLACLLQLALVGLAAATNGDDILGVWETEPTEDGYARVEMFKENGTYHGKIVWLQQPIYPPDDDGGMPGKEKVDRENPDPLLQNRPIIGLTIVKGFVWDGDELWHKGTIYDPNNGKTYKCKAWLTEEGTLKIRGYIGISLLGRNAEWRRLDDQQ